MTLDPREPRPTDRRAPDSTPRSSSTYRPYADPGDGSALEHLGQRRAAVPRPRAPSRLGGHLRRRRRHRARHPQDRQGGRRLPARAGRPRTTPRGGVVMAAKRYRSPEHRSFHRSRRLHRGALGRKRSRDAAGAGHEGPPGAGRSPRASGPVSEWAALTRCWQLGAAGPLPRADRRHGDPDGVDQPSTAPARPGWRRPGRARPARSTTSTSCATRSPPWSRAGIVHGDLSAVQRARGRASAWW